MAGADVMLTPQLLGSLPYALLEAMAAGLPVIATPVARSGRRHPAPTGTWCGAQRQGDRRGARDHGGDRERIAG